MPSFRKIVIPVLVFVLFVGGAFAAYQIADFGQGAAAQDDGQTVTNESHMQQVGMWQFVDRGTNEYTTGFNDSVTVYNSSDVELTEGTDYRWNETEGTIFFENTPNTTDNAQFNITYTYFSNPPETRELDRVLDTITGGLGQMGYFAGGIALVVFLLAFGGFVAKYVGTKSNQPRTRR